jgi:hypothetical protein
MTFEWSKGRGRARLLFVRIVVEVASELAGTRRDDVAATARLFLGRFESMLSSAVVRTFSDRTTGGVGVEVKISSTSGETASFRSVSPSEDEALARALSRTARSLDSRRRQAGDR